MKHDFENTSESDCRRSQLDPPSYKALRPRVGLGDLPLITHTPPFAILDHSLSSERREGCPQLLEAGFQAMPRLHVFGHIHAGYGTLRTTDTLFVNASLVGEDGSLSRAPVVIDLQVR